MVKIKRPIVGLVLRIATAIFVGIVFTIILYTLASLVEFELTYNIIFLIILIVSIIILFINKISVVLARYIVHSYEKEKQQNIIKSKNYYENSIFLLESFIRSIIKPILKINTIHIILNDTSKLVLNLEASTREKYNNMLPLRESYDLDSSWGTIVFDRQRDTMYLFISEQTAATILEILDRGGGEKLVIKNERELSIIYNIIKDIYKEKYRVYDPALSAYVAYKTILVLRKDGIIDINNELINRIPEESPVIRNLVNEQLRLELEEK